MKKLLSVLLLSLLLISTTFALSEPITIDLKTATEDELNQLIRDVQTAINERFTLSVLHEGNGAAATRQNPALIGETHFFNLETYSDNSITAFTMLCSFRGDQSSALLKSFNRYNTGSSKLKKDQEWFAVLFRIEAVDSNSDKIDISDYHFKYVSANGVEYTDRYVADNPLEVKSLYIGSEQIAWVCGIVQNGDTPLITYEKYGGETAWFNPNEHAFVNTADIEYEPLDARSTGIEVIVLQCRLWELGLLKTPPTGKIDQNTQTAIKKAQRSFDLEETGIADLETLRSLYSGLPIL